MKARESKISRSRASGAALRVATADPHGRLRLSGRLRRILTANPDVRHFTVEQIVTALGAEKSASVALFSAAGVFEAPDASLLSARLTVGLGAQLALGHRRVHLPRAVLRRKIPRNSLALLIHSLCAMLEAAETGVHERWVWVFSPLMSRVLGLLVFLLGLASMAPIIGGGVQHAAAAFLVALGMAERDGLAAMIGALAGLASIALAVMSVLSGRQLWARIKAWLLQCARWLHLRALGQALDRCCEGLGELMRLRWSGLLLLMFAPLPAITGSDALRRPDSALRQRVNLVRVSAERAQMTAAA
jgi:hypothetical protein